MLMLMMLACAHLPPEPGAAPPIAAATAPPPVTLQVYETSRGTIGGRLAFQERPREDRPLVASAYLLEHPTAGRVVIDPGYGRRTAAHPEEVPGRSGAKFAGLEMGIPLADQLQSQGVDPASVGTIFVTHMHTDHAAGIEDFPAATVVIDPAEWAFGGRRSALHATIPLPEMETIPTRELTFPDGPYGPFPEHEDVFGDGSLIALRTPGHTPGHTSFLVQLSDRRVLITGDVAWFDEHWEGPALKGRFTRKVVEVDWRRSAQAQWWIHQLQQDDPELVVLSGHDPANLERLPTGTVYR